MTRTELIAKLNAADPDTSAFTLTFPSVEVALAELGQKVFGATIVIAAPPAPPAPEPTPTLPTGLPPIPEGYVYIGEDTGGIVTGDVSLGEQKRTILWFKNTFRSEGWHFTGYVSGCSYGWHAAAPIGHPLAELNAAVWKRDKAAPAVEEALPPIPLAPDIEAHRRLTASIAQDRAITQAQLERDEAVADAHAQREEVKRLAAQCEAAAVEAGKQRDMVKKWRARFAREQMCHAACGVIAMADTRESAIKARDGMHPDYRSPSVNDVARRVDECIALREEVKRLTASVEMERELASRLSDTLRIRINERDLLQEWKRQGLIVFKKWDEVDAYVRQHPDAVIGCNISEIVLAWIKERDELKAKLAALETSRPEEAVSAVPTPAPIYRLLDVGEILREDDEVFVDAPPRSWVRYGKTGDNKIRPGPSGPFPFSYYRRKLTPEEAATGYRLLDVGERLRKDDEVDMGALNRNRANWVAFDAVSEGPLGEKMYPVGYYRRKILPA